MEKVIQHLTMNTGIQRYLKMQEACYNHLASSWSIHKRDPIVGCFDEHETWEDYNYLFDGMFDFHNNASHLQKASELVVLDFGCGPARNMVKYRKHFKRIDGVDISPEVIEKAKEWLTDRDAWNNNRLFVCSGEDLCDIEDNYYDAVMSTITLQHICVYSIRLKLLKEFYRVLKKGGWFTAQMGFGKGKQGSVSYKSNYYDALTTNGWYDTIVEDPKELKLDLESIGFSNFDYFIRPVGPCDSHPNWIFFRAKK